MENNSFEEKVRLELRGLRSQLNSNNLDAAISNLKRRSTIKSVFYIVLEFAIIAFSAYLVINVNYFFVPLSIVLIGVRQRALVVLVHEGSHRNLFGNATLNDILTTLFCAIPMFISLDTYRKKHGEHHRFLGDPDKDSDYLHDPDLIKKGWIKVYFSELLNLESWLGNAFGYPLELKIFAISLLWWGFIIWAMFCVFSLQQVTVFMALWFVSRATIYHAIISFVIISDHVGLVPGGVLGFARNHPATGIIRRMIHPHYNGLHLAHHLLPTVPYHSLRKAHDILLTLPEYRCTEHCDSYFTGTRSVIGSWCKGTKIGAEP